MALQVELMAAPQGDTLTSEFVERKGVGHPDSICDAITEELSLALCRDYLRRFGHILHHNVDKALLWGGVAKPAYGAGQMVRPIELFLAGRATTRVGDDVVPVDEIARATAHDWFRVNIPTLDPERDVVVHSLIRPGSADLVDLFERQRRQKIWLANDTSIGTGYAPLSRLERAVDQIERRLTDRAFRSAHPEVGSDVKVMGVREGERATFIVACALIGRHLRDLEHYLERRAAVSETAREVAEAAGFREPAVHVNAADDPATGSVYLTVSGTSAEAGDDGQAGRGNRVNGLITPHRPMTMESVAGKNPVTHVGKLYNILAGLIAHAVVEKVPEVLEAQCQVVSRIGEPIDRPQSVIVRLYPTGKQGLGQLTSGVAAIVEAELGAIQFLAERIVNGSIAIGRWPLMAKQH
jgi:S-adenosylmethionine synthetase